MRRLIAVGLAAWLLFTASASGQAGDRAEVTGGALKVTLSGSGSYSITYEPFSFDPADTITPPKPGDPPASTKEAYRITPDGSLTMSATGACEQKSTHVVCDAAGVRRIEVVGGNATVGPSDTGGQALRVPVSFAGGDEDNRFRFAAGRLPVTFSTGGGDDGIGGSAGSVQGDLGPGDDVSADLRADTFRITGGAGRDALAGGMGSGTLDGGAGRDRLSATNADGITLVGGDGNDVFEDFASAVTIDAGPGADTLVARKDDRKDVIDCGTGNDTIDNGAVPSDPLVLYPEDSYSNCPTLKLALKKRGRFDRRGHAGIFTATVSSTGAGVGKALLISTRQKGDRKVVASTGKIRLRKGTNRLRFRVTKHLATVRARYTVVELRAGPAGLDPTYHPRSVRFRK